ncbi:MAG: glutamate formimidoyltransferase [Planctomycetes bacterium]|nr:glutamate formimidoyltransferase [Planctomycetota bacterium]
MSEIVECVPNFSEGRRPEVVRQIVDAIRGVAGVTLLGEEMDADHNRSVVTFVGTRAPVEAAAFAGVKVAARLIDLNHHQGQHKRMGACDVLPFVPVRGIDLDGCAAMARSTGERIGRELGVPVYLYEHAATRPERRNLADIRAPEFEGLKDLIGKDPERVPDFGPNAIHPTAGCMAVGARFFLVAYNINLATRDLKLAKAIAKNIREKDGGFRCVKAMGFDLAERGLVQVSMNLTNYTVTPIRTVYDAVASQAAAAGVDVEESELVGLAPRAALDESTAKHVRLRGFDARKQIIESLLGLE